MGVVLVAMATADDKGGVGKETGVFAPDEPAEIPAGESSVEESSSGKESSSAETTLDEPSVSTRDPNSELADSDEFDSMKAYNSYMGSLENMKATPESVPEVAN